MSRKNFNQKLKKKRKLKKQKIGSEVENKVMKMLENLKDAGFIEYSKNLNGSLNIKLTEICNKPFIDISEDE